MSGEGGQRDTHRLEDNGSFSTDVSSHRQKYLYTVFSRHTSVTDNSDRATLQALIFKPNQLL